MAETSIHNIHIVGIATCVPPDINRVVDYELFSTTESDNFIKTVGVSQRRMAKQGVTTADLCQSAANKLLEKLNWELNSIDALIFVTQSADYIIPATSIVLQHKLGLGTHCLAFDINLGCSGYVIGLQAVSSLMSENGIKRALMLVGDVPSGNMSFYDKSTYPLFGDAGTATALEFEQGAPVMHFTAENDGKDFDALYIPSGGMRSMANCNSFEYHDFGEGIRRNSTHLVLDGLRIFNFSITKVPIQIAKILNIAGWNIENTDYFFLHQANRIMNETIRRKLKIPVEKQPYSIGEFGNTSSASIPITICATLGQPNSIKNISTVLSGFGIGLSWASATVILDNCSILPIFDYVES